MAASTHCFASYPRPNRERTVGESSSTSSWADKDPGERLLTESPCAIASSRARSYVDPVSRVAAFTPSHQQSLQLAAVERRGQAVAAERRYFPVNTEWNNASTATVTHVSQPCAPVKSGNGQLNGGHLHTSGPPGPLSAGDCSGQSSSAMATGARLSPCKSLRQAFVRPAAGVLPKTHFSLGRGPFPHVGAIPSCLYPTNVVPLHRGDSLLQNNVLGYSSSAAMGQIPVGGLCAENASREAESIKDGRAPAALPGRLQYCDDFAAASAQPSLSIINLEKKGTRAGLLVSNTYGNRPAPYSADLGGPVLANITAAPRGVDSSTTKMYAASMQQSSLEGQQMQVTTACAVPGAVVTRTIPSAGCTAAPRSSVRPSHGSSSTLLPSTYAPASGNARSSTVSPECPRPCSLTPSCTASHSVPSDASVSAKQHAEHTGTHALQQHPKLLQARQHRSNYLQRAFQAPVCTPAPLQFPTWRFLEPAGMSNLNCMQPSIVTPATGNVASGAYRLQPLLDPCGHSLVRQGNAGTIWNRQTSLHHRQLQQLYRKKRQQSVSGLRPLTAVPATSVEAFATCTPTCDVRVMQRSRSHPPKASLSQSFLEAKAVMCSGTEDEDKAQSHSCDVLRASPEVAEKSKHAIAEDMETPCQAPCGHSSTSNTSSLSDTGDSSAAIPPAFSSVFAPNSHRQDTAAKKKGIPKEDHYGRTPLAGHGVWQPVPVTMRPGQLQRSRPAFELGGGFALQQTRNYMFLLYPPIAALSSDGQMRAAGMSSVAVGFHSQGATHDAYHDTQKETHYTPPRETLCASVMPLEKRAFSCEKSLLRGGEANVDATAASRTASTASRGLRHESGELQTKATAQAEAPESASVEAQEGNCNVSGSGGQIRAQTSDSSIEGLPVQNHEKQKAEKQERQSANVRVETGPPNSSEGQREFQGLSGDISEQLVQLQEKEGIARQGPTTTDAKQDRSHLSREEDAGRSEAAKLTSRPELCESGSSHDKKEDSGCVTATRRTRSGSHTSGRNATRSVGGRQTSRSAARFFSNRRDKQISEDHVHSLQEARDYGEGDLGPTKELESARTLTSMVQTPATNRFCADESTVARRIPDSRSTKFNAQKSDGEEKFSGLPWKSVIVNTKNCRVEKALINTCAQRLGWGRNEVDAFKGHIVWLGGSAPDFEHLHYSKPIQIINRFPGMWDMTKKRTLYRILSLYGQLFPKEYDFFPACWSLPEDRVLIEQMLHGKNKKYYILKPDGGARGNGVQLVSLYKDIDPMVLRGDGSYIMQKYVENPYLLNRKKFDFRIYCVLFSVSGTPKAYVSKLGMVRFCTEEYQNPSRKNIDNPFMHLTNYSINKDNLYSFVRSTDLHDDSNSKRLLKDVFEELAQAGVDVDMVWQQIKDITAKTIVCLQPWLNLRYRHIYRGRPAEPSRCFQLLGLDILLDRTNKCWLLEVNSNPSLRIDYFDSKYDGIDVQLESAVDRHIKEPVVTEALALAYRVLLQQRHPHVQPIPRCCSRNKQSWYLRRPEDATLQATGKEESRSRSHLGRRSSSRISSCCAGSEEEEETETEGAVGRDTRMTRGKERGGGTPAAAEESKSRATSLGGRSMTDKTAGGGLSGASGKEKVDCAPATRCSSDLTMTNGDEHVIVETGADKAMALKKEECIVETIEVAPHPADMRATARISSSRQTAAVTKPAALRRKEKGNTHGDSRSREVSATERSATLLHDRTAIRRRVIVRREGSSNSRKELGHSSAEGTSCPAAQGGRGLAVERNSYGRPRASSAGAANDRHCRRVVSGRYYTSTGPRAARSRDKLRKTIATHDAVSKQTEEEDEDYSEEKICISSRRAVEEARRLLERLGPATTLKTGVVDRESLSSSAGTTGRVGVECKEPPNATYASAALIPSEDSSTKKEVTANAVAATCDSFSSLHHLDKGAQSVGGNGSPSRGHPGSSFAPRETAEEETNTSDRTKLGSCSWATPENHASLTSRPQQSAREISHLARQSEPQERPRMRSAGSAAVITPATSPLLRSSPALTCITAAALSSRQRKKEPITDKGDASATVATASNGVPQSNAGTDGSDVDGATTETTASDAREKHVSMCLSRRNRSPNKTGGTADAVATCASSLGKEMYQSDGTTHSLQPENTADGIPESPRCSTRSNSNCGSARDRRRSSAGDPRTLVSLSSTVGSYPPSPSQDPTWTFGRTMQQKYHVADATAQTLSQAGNAEYRATMDGRQQGCTGTSRSCREDSSVVEVDEQVVVPSATGAAEASDSDERQRSATTIYPESGETRLATEAEQLAVKLGWIEEAYREMEKCMDRFNILGLRFASRAVSSSSACSQQYKGSSTGDGRQQGSEGTTSGSINARRGRGTGGGTAAGTGAGKVTGGKDGKRTGPYKPFLRKDKLASKNGTQTPTKSCYTKLHKVQLLFERIVGFPRLICLQREKLLEACRLVKLPDVLRKVQVPIGFPPTSRSASSRFHAGMRPLSHSSPYCSASAVRNAVRETGGHFAAAGGHPIVGAPELCRSNSGAWLLGTAAAGGRGGGSAAGGASDISISSNNQTSVGPVWKRPHGRSSSSRTGSGSVHTSTTQSTRSTGTYGAGQQAQQQRHGGGCTSMSRLLASRGYVASTMERRRRLGLPDLEALFYAQLQGVRRQLQLQEASFGLGLLETWYLLEPIALVCYPFFPTKAKLLEAFMSPLAAATCHEKQRSSAQMRVLKSPAHADYYGMMCATTKPKLEQMLQQLEEEDRLTFAAADGGSPPSEKLKRTRGRSRCRERTSGARQESGSSSRARIDDAAARHFNQDHRAAAYSTPQSSVSDANENQYHFVTLSNANGLTSAEASTEDGSTDGRVPAEHMEQRWSAAGSTLKCDSTAALYSNATIPTAGRSLRNAAGSLPEGERNLCRTASGSLNVTAVAREGQAADVIGGLRIPAGEEIAAPANGTATVRKRSVGSADTAQNAEKTNICGNTNIFSVTSEYADPPTTACGAMQEQCQAPQHTTELYAGTAVKHNRQLKQNSVGGKSGHQQQDVIPSTGHVHVGRGMVRGSGCQVKLISSNGAAASPRAPRVLSGDRQTPLTTGGTAGAPEACVTHSSYCEKSHLGRIVAEGSVMQEDPQRQPLLFLWDYEQQQQQPQQQRNFVDERCTSTLSSQPSAEVHSDTTQNPYPSSGAPDSCSLSSVGTASSSGGWTPAAPWDGAAAPDGAGALNEDALALCHSSVKTPCGLKGGLISKESLPISRPTRNRESSGHSGSRRGTTSSRLQSVQEGRSEEGKNGHGKDLSRAASSGLSAADAAMATPQGTAASAGAVAAAVDIPDWHAGLCAAWPEDLWGYIRHSVPTEDRLTAMKRLVDYFHLRLDYCSFCALVPGGAGGGKA